MYKSTVLAGLSLCCLAMVSSCGDDQDAIVYFNDKLVAEYNKVPTLMEPLSAKLEDGTLDSNDVVGLKKALDSSTAKVNELKTPIAEGDTCKQLVLAEFKTIQSDYIPLIDSFRQKQDSLTDADVDFYNQVKEKLDQQEKAVIASQERFAQKVKLKLQ